MSPKPYFLQKAVILIVIVFQLTDAYIKPKKNKTNICC